MGARGESGILWVGGSPIFKQINKKGKKISKIGEIGKKNRTNRIFFFLNENGLKRIGNSTNPH